MRTTSKRSGAGAAKALRRLVGSGKKQELLTSDLKAMHREIDLHIAIAKHLKEWAYANVFWWHTPNGEKRDYVTAAKLRRMGVKPGIHDFLFFNFQTRKIYSLEVKRLGETMSMDQQVFASVVRSMGGETACVDTFDGAVQQLERWNLLRIKVGGQL